MRRLLLLPLALLAFAVLVPASPGAAGPSGDGASVSACKWKWKKKRVVKWVRTGVKGKKRRVVRYRKVKVCVPVPPPPAPARLGVKAREFGFTLSAKEVESGDTIVELNNQGEDAHDLHVQRVGGGEELATPETGPGQIARIRLTTVPGSYRLWCSLPNHAAWGMDTTFEAKG